MPVTIGVDPHKSSHTAAALDEHGQVLSQQRFRATQAGCQHLREWAERWPLRCWAVEGAHGVGRSVAQQLVADGEQVVDVPAKLAARVRVLSVGHGRKTPSMSSLKERGWSIPTKKIVSVLCAVPSVQAAAVSPPTGSGWSARSAARTNDLGAVKG